MAMGAWRNSKKFSAKQKQDNKKCPKLCTTNEAESKFKWFTKEEGKWKHHQKKKTNNKRKKKTMAASLNITSHYHFSPSKTSQNFISTNPILSLQNSFHRQLEFTKYRSNRLFVLQPKATLEEDSSVLLQEQKPAETNELLREVEESVKVLKEAAKTRKVKKDEVLAALAIIKNSKLDPSGFIDSLGGSESPGRTWMLVFTAKTQLKSGTYLPITAVQRFDAAARRIENGVYFGPIGCLTFEGRFSWKKRILAFVFETLKIKIGPFDPLQISVGKKEDREPSNKDPFFIWFYVDEEIAVAQGKSGGTAFWCRCCRVT